MLRKPSGASMVEYIVLVILLIALVGAGILGIYVTIKTKLENVNVQLGS